MNTENCPSCGKEMQWMQLDHYETVGRYKVLLKNVSTYRCSCDTAVFSLDQLEHTERVAAAYVLMNCEDINSDVIKFARKALGLTKDEIAFKLGYTFWFFENAEFEIKRIERLALVGLLLCEDSTFENIKLVVK